MTPRHARPWLSPPCSAAHHHLCHRDYNGGPALALFGGRRCACPCHEGNARALPSQPDLALALGEREDRADQHDGFDAAGTDGWELRHNDGRAPLYRSILASSDYLWDGGHGTSEAAAAKMRNQLHAAAYRLGITIRTAIVADDEHGRTVEAWVIARDRDHLKESA